MLKKTAYDLAGIQIRPAIQNLNTGEYIIYRSSEQNVVRGEVRKITLGEWFKGFFNRK
jgi:hypothetical protein